MRTAGEIPKENHGKLVYNILDCMLSMQPYGSKALCVQRDLRCGHYDWHRMLKTVYGKFLMVTELTILYSCNMRDSSLDVATAAVRTAGV
jgi:hypothetical protein